MFTGIIEEIGHVNNVKKGTASAILTIQAEKVLEGTHIGDLSLIHISEPTRH